ncbi:hypothetical protein PM082_012670 [Marasmius tenuissimus]|nr:hypothetical protein PM082_012670 [Marasmius tenuissimus]
MPCAWDVGMPYPAVTNLLAMVFTYFKLYEAKKVVPPARGFVPDGKLPIFSSLDPKYNSDLGFFV